MGILKMKSGGCRNVYSKNEEWRLPELVQLAQMIQISSFNSVLPSFSIYHSLSNFISEFRFLSFFISIVDSHRSSFKSLNSANNQRSLPFIISFSIFFLLLFINHQSHQYTNSLNDNYHTLILFLLRNEIYLVGKK